jgi:hypothetical protein
MGRAGARAAVEEVSNIAQFLGNCLARLRVTRLQCRQDVHVCVSWFVATPGVSWPEQRLCRKLQPNNHLRRQSVLKSNDNFGSSVYNDVAVIQISADT